MAFRRVFVKNIMKFSPILGLISCASNASKYDTYQVNTNGSIIHVSDISYNVNEGLITPQNVELSLTISKLEKQNLDIFGSKHLFNPGDYVEAKNKILVLPIHFTDSKFTTANERNELKADIATAFNGPEEATGFASVKSYFSKSSDGLIDLDITICDFALTSYKSSDINTLDKTIALMNSALQNATVRGNKVNLDDFDGNKDGILDAVWMIYDTFDYKKQKTDNTNLSYYTYPTYNSPFSNPYNVGAFSWASYDLLNDGLENGITLDAHTFIHETGHLFGLNDYYDYLAKSSPMSAFTMMDKNICDFDAYSKMILGWKKPYIVKESCTISSSILKSGHPLVVLSNDNTIYQKDGITYFNPFSEYILVEYFDVEEFSLNHHDLTYGYSPIGLAENSITHSGYKIYHVNSSLGVVEKGNKRLNILNEPETSSKVVRFTSNTSNESSSYSASAILDSAGVASYPNDVDFMNEVTFIAQESELPNNYNSLYIKEDEESGGRYLMQISDKYLFRSGDSFTHQKYNNYFKSAYNEESLTFDNGRSFSSSIIFD